MKELLSSLLVLCLIANIAFAKVSVCFEGNVVLGLKDKLPYWVEISTIDKAEWIVKIDKSETKTLSRMRSAGNGCFGGVLGVGILAFQSTKY